MKITFGKIITKVIPASSTKDEMTIISQEGWMFKDAVDGAPALVSAFQANLPRDMPEGYPVGVDHQFSFEHFVVNEFGGLGFNRYATFVPIKREVEANKPTSITDRAKASA